MPAEPPPAEEVREPGIEEPEPPDEPEVEAPEEVPVEVAPSEPFKAAEDFPLPADQIPEPDLQHILLGQDRLLESFLDNRRGGIGQVRLSEYSEYLQEKEESARAVKLGDWRYPLASLFGEDSVRGRKLLQADDSVMRLQTDWASGMTTVEEWRASEKGGYRLDYRIMLENRGSELVDSGSLMVAAGAIDTGGIEETGQRMQRVGLMDLGIDFLAAGDRHATRFDSGDLEDLDESERRELAAEEIEWLAVHNKYFMLFTRPSETPVSGIVAGVEEEDSEEQEEDDTRKVYGGLKLPAVRLAPGESVQWAFDIYAGPKEYYRIRELGTDMTSVLGMDFFFFGRARWMGSLSTVILRSILFMRNLGLNFGLAIISVTIAVKILFWPLTHKSASSMRKMQKLQPLVKELREKHKSEPQVMNQKIMALYKEHKVNPLGGCLPMLCQIPVFLALFNTLRSAIELRHSGFLWVADLSQPDTLGFMPFGLPIRPLALMSGASMLLQQKLTPTSADPNQARMMMFMSIFFIFIAYRMPAGLTLYWTINQLLTMVQHGILHRLEGRREAEAAKSN